MIKSLLTSSLRYLNKNKLYALISIFSFSLSLSMTFLILFYIQFERSYDHLFPEAERIVRIEERWHAGDLRQWAPTSSGVMERVSDLYPEIDGGTRFFFHTFPKEILVGDVKFVDLKIAYADSNYQMVFKPQAILGDPGRFLAEVDNVVVTESTAKRMFGDENVLGKLLVKEDHTYKISGVIKDFPANLHYRYDILFPMRDVLRDMSDNNKNDNNFYTYFKLKKGTDLNLLERKINENVKAIAGERYSAGNEITFSLVPLLSIHLHGKSEREIGVNGNASTLTVLTFACLILLVFAIINYVNLATALSLNRSKEVVLRKMFGIKAGQIFFTFIAESFLLCSASLLMSALIVALAYPSYVELLQIQPIFVEFFKSTEFVYFILAFLIVVLASGTLPAWRSYSLKFNSNALKNNTTASLGVKGLLFRRALIVVQFSLSLVLIVGALVINRQIQFVQEKELGFGDENIIVVHTRFKSLWQNAGALKDKLRQHSFVSAVAQMNSVPGERVPYLTVGLPSPTMATDPNGKTSMRVIWGDENLIETLQLQIVEGRNFTASAGQFENSFIVNESAVKSFAIEDPIGKPFTYYYTSGGEKKGNIVGIVRDFHFGSLRDSLEPVAIHVANAWTSYLCIRLKSDDFKNDLQAIEKDWKEIFPDMPFSFYFLDDGIQKLYNMELQLRKVISIFAVLAVAISLLGLIGMISYTISVKQREIGIRKVLGSNDYLIILSIGKEFFVLMLFSLIIALPPSIMLINGWLDKFVYRISLNVIDIAFAGGLLFLCVAFTVFYHITRISDVNPIKVIRQE